MRKVCDTKLKRYWYELIDKKLYVYKNKGDQEHKGILSLLDVKIKDHLGEDSFDSNNVLYPFTLTFPGNKERIYYLLK